MIPITLRVDVHVLSVRGAKEAIIRAPAGTPPMANVFFPIQSMPPLVRSQQQAVVLVDYSTAQYNSLDGIHGPLLDGFTLHREYAYPPHTDWNDLNLLDPRWRIGSFLWDGEGYGNPRVADSTVVSGNSVDIGFDETNFYCVAGSYGNDPRSHNQSCRPGVIPDGDRNRNMIFPKAGTYWLYLQSGFIGLGWNWIPGTRPVSLTNQPLRWLYLVQPGLGDYYIDPIYWVLAIGAGTVYPDGWVYPTDNKPYTFGQTYLTTPNPPDPDPLPCQVLNQQVIFNKLNTSDYKLSNLQSEYF